MSKKELSARFSENMCILVFFFFFQAEDGIRDGTVTGVQTCALPIFAPFVASTLRDELRESALMVAMIGVGLGCVLWILALGSSLEWTVVDSLRGTFEIGRASCREKSVDLGGRGIIKKKTIEG